MQTYRDAAYAMASFSAVIVAFRMLIKKGLIDGEEVSRALLDEAVTRAIFAEGHATDERLMEINRQCAEILKVLADQL